MVEELCKGLEAENWWFEDLKILKDLLICSMVSKEKDIGYGFGGKKSWGGKGFGF